MNDLEKSIHAQNVRRIVETISNISERIYYATWHIGVEYDIFAELLKVLGGTGTNRLKSGEITELCNIYIQIGGWVHWPENNLESPEFIKMVDWVPLYKDHFDIKKDITVPVTFEKNSSGKLMFTVGKAKPSGGDCFATNDGAPGIIPIAESPEWKEFKKIWNCDSAPMIISRSIIFKKLWESGFRIVKN